MDIENSCSEQVKALTEKLLRDGVSAEDVAATLLGYAVALWNAAIGPEYAPRQLYMLAISMREDLDAATVAALVERADSGAPPQ